MSSVVDAEEDCCFERSVLAGRNLASICAVAVAVLLEGPSGRAELTVNGL
jgi:hypothetical protein